MDITDKDEFEALKKEVQELKATVNFLMGFADGVRSLLNNNDFND